MDAMLKKIYEDKKLLKMLEDYYYNYYFLSLKIKNWKNLFFNNRIYEEEKIGKKVINCLLKNKISLQNKKILVVGAGTGAELFYLFSQGIRAFALEPCSEAYKILSYKANLLNFPYNCIVQAAAEDMPFDRLYFDVIICYTVLEHVKDVEKALKEMYRVLAPNGVIFVLIPNYYFPEEQHYKTLIFPPKISKNLARLTLIFKKRYTHFFETLNFLGGSDLENIIERLGIKVETTKIHKRTTFNSWRNITSPGGGFRYFISNILTIPRSYIYIIKKF